jgi:transcriptional regulator with XRE-family HTH domain
VHPWPPIGENLARLRGLAGLTQDTLAERADVSADLIRRLEQGSRQTALIGSLYKIANALDVPLSILLSQQPILSTASDRPPEPSPEDTVGRIEGLRRLLQPAGLPAPEQAEPIVLGELRRSSREAWKLYRAGELASLATVLTPLIVSARTLAEELSGQERDQALTEESQLYNVASGVLVQLGYGDLGYLAAERAIATAMKVDDPLLPSVATGAMEFVLLRQGRMAEAEALAVKTAEANEPRFARATAEHLATYGLAIWTGMTAAARQGRTSQATDLLNLMEATAHRLGQDRVDDYSTWFGPTTVGMQSVAFAAECGEFGKSLTLAARVPAEGGAATITRMRHRLDVANAQAHESLANDAIDTLIDVRQQAPEWIRYQILARETVRMLLGMRGVSRQKLPALLDLARHLNVQA